MEKSLIEGRHNLYILIVKRFFDIIIGIIGTVFLFLPFSIIIFIIYKLKGYTGSIFFKQERNGLNGKKFKILKFRSMVENAEEVLKADKELYEKYIQNSYKVPPEEDPRLTSIGEFIRKTSIDELPQFINILKGEMSFIGPRPILDSELLEYTESERLELLSVKPGATGWWQVSGRSHIMYPERCEVELYYVRNVSFSLDLKIIWLSFQKVFLREGAH